jgi:tetratricopeptide (TPR) repeat protein
MAPDPAVQELRLSLCMIVRNSVSTLGACLRSIRPWVDEMVIVDTGSTDDTVQLAAGLGARVFHYPWSDSFSAARNESLRHARGQWIFWMDSDDTIDETNGRKLRELSSRDPGPSVLGYVMQVYCPGTVASESRGADVTAVDHVKLLRNLPHLRFEGRIHEQVLPAIRAAGGDVLWTDVHVVHSGSDQSPKGRQRKWERDLRLLELDLRDRPDHTFVLFNLGMTYADAGEHGKAVEAFCKSLAAAHPQESHVRKAYALLCASQCALGQHQEARVACQSGLRLYPDDLELRFLQGNLAFREGRLDEAQAAYLAVLSGTTPRYFASIDRGIAGFKARHNLAAVYQEMGLPHQAESQWLQVLAEAPRYPPACRGLGQLLLQQNRLNELDDFAERLEDEDTDLVGLRLLLQGLAAEARGDIGDARHKLQEAFEAEPHDLTICDARCRFLFENGGPEEAEGALVDLAAKDPANGSVHHNLGAIYARVGRHADAIRAYRHSLHLRPDAAATRALLNEVLSRLNPQADNGRDRASEILASAD